MSSDHSEAAPECEEMIFLLLLACTQEQTWKLYSEGAPCDEQPFQELKDLCLVDSACHTAQRGMDKQARDICQSMQPGVWRDECYFHVGEELSRIGALKAGLHSCELAGSFFESCVSHVIWSYDPGSSLRSDAISAVLRSNLQVTLSQLKVLTPSPDRVVPPSETSQPQTPIEELTSKWWLQPYEGSGVACPVVGSAYAKTGFAVEATRLGASPEQLLESWRAGTCFRGSPSKPRGKPLRCRHGRTVGVWPDKATVVVGPGNSRRLTSEDEEVDLLIAALTGIYLRGNRQELRSWLDDPHPLVTETAQRLLQDQKEEL